MNPLFTPTTRWALRAACAAGLLLAGTSACDRRVLLAYAQNLDNNNGTITPADDGGACDPRCTAPLPHCDARTMCVECIEDSHCPVGHVCRDEACVAGCTDDARCRGTDPSSRKSCCGGRCVDTPTDTANCGGCGMVCGSAHAAATCTSGQCKITCADGWGDCNNDASDGCETSLHADTNNCGTCGKKCSFANGVAGCADKCYLKACQFGFEDCDGDEANGCETDITTDLKNCGACGNSCANRLHAKTICVSMSCLVTSCDPGYADCNNDGRDGCEVTIGTDPKNCGKCGNVCPFSILCKDGGCTG